MKWKLFLVALVATQVAEAQQVNFHRQKQRIAGYAATIVKTVTPGSGVSSAATVTRPFVDNVSPGSLNQSQCLAQGAVFVAEVDMNRNSGTYGQRFGTCYTQQAYACRILVKGVDGQMVGGSNDPIRGAAGNIGCQTRQEVYTTRNSNPLAMIMAEANTLSILREIAYPGSQGGINSTSIPVSAELRAEARRCVDTGIQFDLYSCINPALRSQITAWEEARRAQIQGLTSSPGYPSQYCMDYIPASERAVGAIPNYSCPGGQ